MAGHCQLGQGQRGHQTAQVDKLRGVGELDGVCGCVDDAAPVAVVCWAEQVDGGVCARMMEL